MRGINHVVIAGNLGEDPEARETRSGDPVLTFPLGISRKMKGRNGTDEEVVTWVRVVCFRELAGLCERNLSKGDEVLVYGKLNIRELENRETGEKKRMPEVQAREINFISVRKLRG